jgi:hypothetical protein
MNGKAWICMSMLLALATAGTTFADDLTGAQQLLCTSVKAMECYADGGCIDGEPEIWNVPRFVRVDLEQQVLTTTEASGEKRSTPIERIESEGDRIFFQGAEEGRAFSVVLNQTTGMASTGIALDGHVVSVFSYCTPIVTAD